MKIRIRFFILFLLIALAIGYLLGCIWPFSLLQVEINQEPISAGDHWRNLISLIAAIGSVSAVIVALFKEEIQGCFKSVKLDFELGDSKALEEIDPNETEHPKANRYRNYVTIKNNGNVNALSCEACIEKIEFKGNGDISPKPQKITNDKFSFGLNASQVYIPAQGSKSFEVFQLTSSTMPSSGESSPLLKIGENSYTPPYAGVWTIECTIMMTNAKPVPFVIVLEWNGKWCERINEMQVKTSIKK